MTNISSLSDGALLDETRRVVQCERDTTASLIALLAEVDTRKLYLGEGYSSLFTFCTHALHLSEHAAYGRITAARSARRFPTILARLQSGDVTLTTVTLLAPQLDDENHEGLLNAAQHKSKREVEQLVAALHPQPDIASSVRRLPERCSTAALAMQAAPLLRADDDGLALAPDTTRTEEAMPSRQGTPVVKQSAASRPVIAPLAPERYLIKVTVDQTTYDKLARARDLLRHVMPSGDAAAIIDRALSALVEQLERSKLAATSRPRAQRATIRRTRHIPASVRRAVWAKDTGRCAFSGTDGRCMETGQLEFHHVVPFAAGGATSVENLQLRCRAHNGHEARVYFGAFAK